MYLGFDTHTRREANLEEILRVMDKSDVRYSCLSSLRGLLYSPTLGNDELSKINDKRIIKFAHVNPIMDYPDKEIAKRISQGFKGFEMCPELYRTDLRGDAFSLDNILVDRIVRKISKTNLPLFIRSRHAVSATEVKRLAERNRKAKLLVALDHMKYIDSIGATISSENVYVVLSGMPLHSQVIERGVRLAGAKKIVFGSSYPYYNMRSRIWMVENAEISKKEKEQILYENMARLLNL